MKAKKEYFHKRISIALLLLFFSFNVVNIHAYEHIFENDAIEIADCTDCKILLEDNSSHSFTLLDTFQKDCLVDRIYKSSVAIKYISVVPATIDKGFLFCRPPPNE